MNKCPKHPEQNLTKSGCFRCWKEKHPNDQILKPMDNDIKIVKAIEILTEQYTAPEKVYRALNLLVHNFE